MLSEKEEVNCVTDEQNAQLVVPILNDEVKEAVFLKHAEKAPGYDRLNPCFYQAYWSVVEKDVVGFCQHFFYTGELQMELNCTVVCLIRKLNNHNK